MEKPSLEQLDNVRKEGFRPSVVACLINNKRLLLVFKKEYKLWQLPQGGVNNKEDPDASLERELKEEMGTEFVSNLDFSDIRYIGQDKMEFKPGRHNVDVLKDDSGNEVNMLGKLYYFTVINSKSDKLDISKTVYDEHFWMNFQEAKFLADKIYQRGKRRITLNIIDELFNRGIIE